MDVPDAELAAVLAMVRGRGPALVAVGHGRDPASTARGTAFAQAWAAGGGVVTDVVSWPAQAASWLRQANRLVAGAPDLWVVADQPPGWSGFGPRLAATGRWRAERTVAFSGLAHPDLPALAGWAATEALAGATESGHEWWVRDGELRTGALWS